MRSVRVNDTIMFFQFMPLIDSSFFEVLILLYSLVFAAFVYSLSAFSICKFLLTR